MHELALVTVVVHDYDEAATWFREVLGFELVEDTSLGGGKRWVVVRPRGAGTGLLLARAADDHQGTRVGDQTGGRVFLFLHTDDILRDHSRLRDLGVQIDAVRHEPYGKVAVFRDVAGNRWDLIEPVGGLREG